MQKLIRHRHIIATITQAVRSARDDLAARIDASSGRHAALEAKVDLLADQVAGLADATRALLMARTPVTKEKK